MENNMWEPSKWDTYLESLKNKNSNSSVNIDNLKSSIDNYNFDMTETTAKKITDNPASYNFHGKKVVEKSFEYGVEIGGKFYGEGTDEYAEAMKKNEQLKILKSDCITISNSLSQYRQKIAKSVDYANKSNRKLKKQKIGGKEQEILKKLTSYINSLDNLDKEVESFKKQLDLIVTKIK